MSDDPLVVLIAEDEALASMALRAQVEALGHTVRAVARDGNQAADLTRCLPIEMAIFDMKMPGISGLEAARRAFPDAPTPVLLLTGFGAADLPDPLPRPPIFALVSKPVGLDDLRTGIRRASDAFRSWADTADHADLVARSRDDRQVIGRALERLGGQTPDAATRFLARARDENTPPADLARRILQEHQAR